MCDHPIVLYKFNGPVDQSVSVNGEPVPGIGSVEIRGNVGDIPTLSLRFPAMDLAYQGECALDEGFIRDLKKMLEKFGLTIVEKTDG